jgi:hypothetical protein
MERNKIDDGPAIVAETLSDLGYALSSITICERISEMLTYPEHKESGSVMAAAKELGITLQKSRRAKLEARLEFVAAEEGKAVATL